MDDVQITLSFPPDVAAHILDVLVAAFPSDEPRTPAELVKPPLEIFVTQKWLDGQWSGLREGFGIGW